MYETKKENAKLSVIEYQIMATGLTMTLKKHWTVAKHFCITTERFLWSIHNGDQWNIHVHVHSG